MVHHHAAELDVQYQIGDATRSVSVPRTVHLVAVGGGWRSLCYPTAATTGHRSRDEHGAPAVPSAGQQDPQPR